MISMKKGSVSVTEPSTHESDTPSCSGAEYEVLRREVQRSISRILKPLRSQKTEELRGNVMVGEDALLPARRKRCKSLAKQRHYQAKYLANLDTINWLLRIHRDNSYRSMLPCSAEVFRGKTLEQSRSADTADSMKEYYCFNTNVSDKHYSIGGGNEDFAMNNERVRQMIRNSKLLRLKRTPIKCKAATNKSEQHYSNVSLMKQPEIYQRVCKKTETLDYKVNMNYMGEFPRIKLQKFSFASEHKFKKTIKTVKKIESTRQLGALNALVLYKDKTRREKYLKKQIVLAMS